MRLITIQNIEVLKQLENNNTYYANSVKMSNKKNLVKPYTIMQKHYKYSNIPVFCCVVGRYAEFYGAATKDSLILELNVPDNLVNLQAYYNWSDVIYFTEFPNEWEASNFNKFIVDTLNGLDTDHANCIIQATIPYIKPDWLIGHYKLTKNFLDLHYGSGGNNILTESSYK